MWRPTSTSTFKFSEMNAVLQIRINRYVGDQDPTCPFIYADPDPTFAYYADPDPVLHQSVANLLPLVYRHSTALF
jgi:hypothetical protein